MDCAFVESVISSGIPGAQVEARIENRFLNLTVCCGAKGNLDATKRVYDTLLAADILDAFTSVKVNWFPDMHHRIAQQVDTVVRDALKPLEFKYALSVSSEVYGDTLAVKLQCREFESKTTGNGVKNLLSKLSHEFLAISGADRLTFYVGAGLPTYSPYSSDGVGPEDEDEDRNPNWPSKTGNPSGKGRGNNP